MRGFTARHPDIPADLRGTYAGLGHPAAISYLKELGVTAVELLPIHHFVTSRRCSGAALKNYWGYNSIGFFAPHAAYATHTGRLGGNQVREFKAMVRAMHAAGIEVILDVVYNHTGEATPDGPMLSFRGIDNAGYYRVDPADPAKYLDYTGCGNTLDVRTPAVLQLVMDSLRYWVTEMHVDGFRFDLASALARSLHDVDKLSSFFDTIHQDPIISRVKLIAEPWDIGDGGYQVGEFPPLWTEWNGKYRDTVRDFWAHGAGGVRDLAFRLTGSSDLYADDGRLPFASINFITAHDGFTMRDLASYLRKHNEANGEANADGTDDNRSINFGVEGETADPEVNALRLKQVRNLLTTLLLSTGAPMLVAGDERYRTQGGNNNAYVQDNEVSWLDWDGHPGRRRPAGADPAADRAAPGLAGAAAAGVLRGPGDRRRRLQGPGLVPPGRRRAERPRLVRPGAAHHRHVPRRPRAAAPRPARAGHPGRVLPAAAALRRAAGAVRAARPAVGRPLPGGDRHHRGGRPVGRPNRSTGGSEITVAGRSVLLLRADRD